MRKGAVTYAARSDMGRVRRNNEDNLYCCGTIITEELRDLPFKVNGQINAPCVFAVCDGMGGHQLGELASITAVRVLAKHAGKLTDCPEASLNNVVQEYVAAANREIYNGVGNQTIRMGTTLALAVVFPHVILGYNLGDSRIYTLDKSGFRQISADHSVAMEKAMSGIYTKDEARWSDDWNKLTACLGFRDDNGSDYQCEVLPPVKRDRDIRLLLCSDGLTDMLPDGHIESIMRLNRSVEQTALVLLSEALNSGGTDNITVIVADVPKKSRRFKLTALIPSSNLNGTI